MIRALVSGWSETCLAYQDIAHPETTQDNGSCIPQKIVYQTYGALGISDNSERLQQIEPNSGSERFECGQLESKKISPVGQDL